MPMLSGIFDKKSHVVTEELHVEDVEKEVQPVRVVDGPREKVSGLEQAVASLCAECGSSCTIGRATVTDKGRPRIEYECKCGCKYSVTYSIVPGSYVKIRSGRRATLDSIRSKLSKEEWELIGGDSLYEDNSGGNAGESSDEQNVVKIKDGVYLKMARVRNSIHIYCVDESGAALRDGNLLRLGTDIGGKWVLYKCGGIKQDFVACNERGQIIEDGLRDTI